MKIPNTLYSRLALATSVTLVVGYFVVYAAYQTFTSPEYQSGAPLSSTFLGKIVSNLDEINGRVTTLEWSIAGASVWSKVGSDINYTAGKVGVWATTGNAELDIQSGIKPHWGIYHDSTSEELRFWNGDNRVVIGSTGNVGIGTVSPSGLLQISSSAPTFVFDANSQAANVKRVRLGSSFFTAGDLVLQAMNDDGSVKSTNMTFTNGGNIGIGTVSPGAKLEIAGNAATAGIRFNYVPASYPTTYLADIYYDGTLTNYEGLILQSRGSTTTNGTILLNPNGGNVWIGTTTPGTRLSVIGAAGATAMSVGASANNWAETIYGSSVANQSFGTQITGGTNTVDYGLIVYNYAQTTPMLVVRGDGYVGIWTLSPAYKLQVMWSVASNSTVLTSDRRFKKNITPITSALDAIEKLQWVTFDWRIGEFTNRNFPEGKQIGFIAQDVEKVLPEVVTTDNEGYKWVEYANITAVLVEAVKELKKENSVLKTQNKLIEERLNNLENK